MAKFEVGQKVWHYDVNSRKGPDLVGVTKVGRKLVTVSNGSWWTKTFRIEDGQANDQNYSHHDWIRTEEERIDQDHRAELIARLKDFGVEFRYGKQAPTVVLEKWVEIIEVEAGNDG